MTEEIIEEEGTPAVKIGQVDVYIYEGDSEEPRIIKAPTNG